VCQYAVINVTPAVLSRLRDDRLSEVSGSTVNRDFNLISHVFTTAMIEWGVSLPFNPVSRVRRPKENRARNRRIEGDEDVRLLAQCKKSRNKFLYPAVLTLIDSGMRRSEVVGMQWPNVHIDTRTVWLSDSKNGEGRWVPLSTRAVEALSGLDSDRTGPVFPGLTVVAIKCAFQRAMTRAGIQGLRMHDLRHEATSKLFEKGLNVMEVASVRHLSPTDQDDEPTEF